MARIGLIINPNSCGGRTGSLLAQVYALLPPDSVVAVTSSLSDLDQAALDLRGCDCLAIMGGDGTLHRTLTAFLRTGAPLPPVALLRGGTMNTVASSVGIRGSPLALLGILRGLLSPLSGPPAALPTLAQPLLQVNDSVGFLFGTGIIYNFLQAYYATGAPSPRTAAQLLLRGVASGLTGGALARSIVTPFTARVAVDGVPWSQQRFIAIAAGTIKDIGLGFRPFPHAGRCPDRVALLGLHTSALGFAAELPRLRAGVLMSQERCLHAQAMSATFDSDRPLPYMVDGELYPQPTGALRVGRGPTIQLITLTSPRATPLQALWGAGRPRSARRPGSDAAHDPPGTSVTSLNSLAD